MELTEQQASILERLHAHNFEVMNFPVDAEYVGVQRGNCAALLAAQASGGFSIYGQPAYLVGGNFSAKILEGDGHYFVAQNDKLKVTPERNAELESFAADLAATLLPIA